MKAMVKIFIGGVLVGMAADFGYKYFGQSLATKLAGK